MNDSLKPIYFHFRYSADLIEFALIGSKVSS